MAICFPLNKWIYNWFQQWTNIKPREWQWTIFVIDHKSLGKRRGKKKGRHTKEQATMWICGVRTVISTSGSRVSDGYEYGAPIRPPTIFSQLTLSFFFSFCNCFLIPTLLLPNDSSVLFSILSVLRLSEAMPILGKKTENVR